MFFAIGCTEVGCSYSFAPCDSAVRQLSRQCYPGKLHFVRRSRMASEALHKARPTRGMGQRGRRERGEGWHPPGGRRNDQQDGTQHLEHPEGAQAPRESALAGGAFTSSSKWKTLYCPPAR
jgi:hypothetical protein